MAVKIYSLFKLCARWGRVVSATALPLYPGKDTRYKLYRKLGGPKVPSGQALKSSPPQEFDPRNVQA